MIFRECHEILFSQHDLPRLIDFAPSLFFSFCEPNDFLTGNGFNAVRTVLNGSQRYFIHSQILLQIGRVTTTTVRSVYYKIQSVINMHTADCHADRSI